VETPVASAQEIDPSTRPGRCLSLRLLGGFQATIDGEPVIGFESDLVRALLAYLAVERDRMHRRDWLATFFWPEQPESVASHRLRQALSNLRRALGDAESAAPLLIATRTDVQLAAETRVHLDVSEFADLIAASRAHAHRRLSLCRSCRRSLERASALYAGPFLAGLSVAGSPAFQEWAAVFGERLHQRALDLLLTLASIDEQHGAYEEARAHAWRALGWEPWNEAAHRQVMRALALEGKRDAALRQFQQCRQILDQELGVGPSPETAGLCARIRAGETLGPDTTANPRHNLPSTVSSFVGREAETTALQDLLASERLVTLTGAGGVGKTRLAQHVAASLVRDFVGGVWLVELAALADPRLVPTTVADVLGLREPAQRPLLELIRDFLKPREALLILDNCEHLVEACAAIAAGLLRDCPNLTILATSRQPLRVNGEVSWTVPPLATPPAASELRRSDEFHEALLSYDAVRLFVERARTVEPGFALSDDNGWAVAGICRRLDGIPLALELAASRLRALPPRAMLERMASCLPLLTGGPRDLPARQRTLRDTIAWSYDLLSADEQTLFRRLGVFRGCSLEGVEAVCATPATQPGSSSITFVPLGMHFLEGVASLVEKNLLRQDELPDGQPWFSMLETVREFAQERLAESGEADIIHRRHALFYLEVAESAEPEIRGPEEGTWRARIERENDNLRAALEYCRAHGYVDPCLRLAVALWWFWLVGGHVTEGRQHLDALLARFPLRTRAGRRPLDWAKAVRGAATLASIQGDFVTARSLQDEGLATSRAVGDVEGVCTALESLASIASRQGDDVAARTYAQELLANARSIGDNDLLGAALLAAANVYHEQGDLPSALELAEESVALSRLAANQTLTVACQLVLAVVLQDVGDANRAWTLTEAALATCGDLGLRRTGAMATTNLGSFALARGNRGVARQRFTESLVVQRELADTAGVAFVLERFVGLAVSECRYATALSLAGAASVLREEVGSPLPPRRQVSLNDDLSSARQALGAERAAEAWATGRAMPMDAAIGLALQSMTP
jgi:predicted ATPase/DNA-binding SARP family transcriptional activator